MPMSRHHLLLSGAALLVAVLSSAVADAQNPALPAQPITGEFGAVSPARTAGRARWHGQMQVQLDVLPSCHIDLARRATPPVRCSRGVPFRTQLLNDPAPRQSGDADTSSQPVGATLLRISGQRLLVEF